MARNIMVSNRVYEELKREKGERSFSEVIAEALEKSNGEKKTFDNLMKFAGILKDEKEDKNMVNWLKKAQKMTDERIWGKSR